MLVYLRHGILRVQSFGPEETLTLFVRYLASLSVGSPGSVEIKGLCLPGCEKSMHAPFSGLPPCDRKQSVSEGLENRKQREACL